MLLGCPGQSLQWMNTDNIPMACQQISVTGRGSVWSFSWSSRQFLGLTPLCHSPHIYISACKKWLWNSSKQELSFFLSGSSTLPVHRYKCLDKVPRKKSGMHTYCYSQGKQVRSLFQSHVKLTVERSDLSQTRCSPLCSCCLSAHWRGCWLPDPEGTSV